MVIDPDRSPFPYIFTSLHFYFDLTQFMRGRVEINQELAQSCLKMSVTSNVIFSNRRVKDDTLQPSKLFYRQHLILYIIFITYHLLSIYTLANIFNCLILNGDEGK